MTDRTIKARVWVNQGTNYLFPEQQLPQPQRPPKVAVCISGGGSRSQSAAMGQLRGLQACGALAKVGYLSCVSGGSWAAVPYTYYCAGPKTDEELLGPVQTPSELTQEVLETLPETRLAIGSTRDFKAVLEHELEHNPDSHEAWITTVGKVFLQPFGLYTEHQEQAFFAFDTATAEAIKKRNADNPDIQQAAFLTVRHDLGARPYLVVNSCTIWPAGLFDIRNKQLTGFEYTPLYAGNPLYQHLRDHHLLESKSRFVGGGYLEPFALGSPSPGSQLDGAPEGLRQVSLAAPVRPFSLADAAGTSSSAYSAIATDITDKVSPQLFDWPISSHGNEDAENAGEITTYGDGGNLENQGLIAMLRRGIDRLIVFTNTSTKINVAYDPAHGPKDSDFDSSVAELFGFHKNRHFDNQVFTRADWQDLVGRFIAIKKQDQHGPLAVLTEYEVQPNSWWGITTSFKATILWVYNERVPAWEAQLPQTTRDWMKIGAHDSQFNNFPNYKTIGQDSHGFHFTLVELTPAQVNALAELSCWNVEQLWQQGLIQKIID